MLTATQLYNAITRSGSNYLSTIKAEPSVKTATSYFLANIGNVKSATQLVNNSRLYNYVMNAFGLSNEINAKALITKVLEGGTGSESFAESLNDPRYTALVEAFNFKEDGTATTKSTSTQQTTVSNYNEQMLENNAGQQNQGAQMALYFKRMASQITSAYSILGNATLLKTVETAFNLPSSLSEENIDTQAQEIGQLLDISKLQNSTYLNKFLERFTASYDAQNPTGGNTAPPTVAMLVSQPGISSSLLLSIATLKLGGS